MIFPSWRRRSSSRIFSRSGPIPSRGTGLRGARDTGLVAPGPFHGSYILGLFHHAHQALVPLGVLADFAQVPFAQIKALPAQMDVLLRIQKGLGQSLYILLLHVQHMVGQPQGGLGPMPGSFRSCSYSRAMGFTIRMILP